MNYDALETALKPILDPGIYVEPRDNDLDSEDDRQAVFVATMRRTAKACRVYAVPNGGKRTHWAAAKAKREGMIAGEPDIGVTWADAPTARIEFKDGKGKPSDVQIEALNWYFLRGHPVAICRTCEGAMAWLASLDAPVPRLR